MKVNRTLFIIAYLLFVIRGILGFLAFIVENQEYLEFENNVGPLLLLAGVLIIIICGAMTTWKKPKKSNNLNS